MRVHRPRRAIRRGRLASAATMEGRKEMRPAMHLGAVRRVLGDLGRHNEEVSMKRGTPRRPNGKRKTKLSTRPAAAYAEALDLALSDSAGNRSRIFTLLRTAAGAGHAMAQHALATWYLFGVGVKRNYRK